MALEIIREQSAQPYQEAMSDRRRARLTVSLASTESEVHEAQALRYRVFAGELGARLHSSVPGRDVDSFDAFCSHLIVRDAGSGCVVACMRVLDHDGALRAGGYYSETEFELGALRSAPGLMLELGRTCVHPDYRGATAVSMLWAGLGRFFDINAYQRIIGCVSVPMGPGGAHARAVFARLEDHHHADVHHRAAPLLPLPGEAGAATGEFETPSLLRAYLRLGARVCGEPCWDPAFDCADLLVMLRPADLRSRYFRRYLSAA